MRPRRWRGSSRGVAAAVVEPRWRQLAADEISEKAGPWDLVTVADREAEERLTEALTALLPGSVMVGEESVSDDPDVLGRLRSARLCPRRRPIRSPL